MAENKQVKPRTKKGLWKPEEDLILKNYVETHGEGNWATVSQKSGLMRGGKSCRLRWKNYLRPNIKRGRMSQQEEDLIIRMHKLIGNRWSLIAGRLPGRTDNEVKNYWNTHLNKSFRPAKTKSTDTNTCQNGNNDNNRSTRQCNLQTTSGASTMSISEELNGQEDKKESNVIADAWIEEAQIDRINYCNESPVATANNDGIMFDDEPFVAYLDSLVLFESFGYIGDETFT